MSLFDQLLRRAVAAACLVVTAETARAELPEPAPQTTPPALPVPTALPAPTAEAVIPASGIGRGPFGMRTGPHHYQPKAAPNCAPGVVCPPLAPGATPPTVAPPGMVPVDPPVQPPVQPPAAPQPDFGDFGRNVAGVGSGSGSFAPNLFGDILGTRTTQVRIQQTMPGFLNGKTVVVAVNGLTNTGGGTGGSTTLSGNFSNGSLSVRNMGGAQIVSLPTTPTIMGIPVTNPTNLSTFRIGGAFTETVPGTNQVYTSNGVGGASANYIIQYFAGTSGARPGNVPFTIPAFIPVGFGRDTLVPQIEQAANPGVQVTDFQLSPVQGVFDGTELRYFSTISTTVSSPSLLLSIPNPGGGSGGVVGIVKISEDNNPLPRDRVIFNYDYFSEVPFTPGGIPVNRYQVGIEKTFLDGRGSVEVRLPFASTLNSDGMMNGTGTNTELGNLRLALKALLLRRETVNISTGLGVYLPTADDLNIRQANGANLIRVENSSVQLSPFAALLYTPTERLFGQAWMGFTFDTGGNAVTVDPMMFGGRANVGNLRAATLWTVDAQVGYWVYLAESGFLRGVAPFVELHYNGTVSNGSVLNAGSGLFIGDTLGNSDELNLTSGLTTRLGEQSSLAVAATAPLRTGQNRTFDYQIGVRLNYYFGYTARNQNRGTFVSTAGR